MNTKEFAEMYFKNLWPGEGQETAINLMAQQIDKHFISIEKHLFLLKEAKLENQKLNEIINQNQELIILLKERFDNDQR